MGTLARRKPRRLAEKLLEIRKAFGDSQNGLVRRLGLGDELTQSDISAFERSTREPPLHVLLRYSELARVWINVLVDDEVDLPEDIPAAQMHSGIGQVRTPAGKRRKA
jgi:transcriptional regulator with XRE-family HTH domain